MIATQAGVRVYGGIIAALLTGGAVAEIVLGSPIGSLVGATLVALTVVAAVAVLSMYALQGNPEREAAITLLFGSAGLWAAMGSVLAFIVWLIGDAWGEQLGFLYWGLLLGIASGGVFGVLCMIFGATKRTRTTFLGLVGIAVPMVALGLYLTLTGSLGGVSARDLAPRVAGLCAVGGILGAVTPPVLRLRAKTLMACIILPQVGVWASLWVYVHLVL